MYATQVLLGFCNDSVKLTNNDLLQGKVSSLPAWQQSSISRVGLIGFDLTTKISFSLRYDFRLKVSVTKTACIHCRWRLMTASEKHAKSTADSIGDLAKLYS